LLTTPDRRQEYETLAGRLARRLSGDHGLTAIEYALIAGLIFLVIVIAVKNVGTEVTKPYETIATEMSQ
jgi:Flp pilus assembly pilin Flp